MDERSIFIHSGEGFFIFIHLRQYESLFTTFMFCLKITNILNGELSLKTIPSNDKPIARGTIKSFEIPQGERPWTGSREQARERISVGLEGLLVAVRRPSFILT